MSTVGIDAASAVGDDGGAGDRDPVPSAHECVPRPRAESPLLRD
jgi:hypothetical protein